MVQDDDLIYNRDYRDKQLIFEIKNLFTLVLPVEFKIYQFYCCNFFRGFYVIYGAGFEFLVSDPYVSLGSVEKKLKDITREDFVENKIKSEKFDGFSKINRLQFIMDFALGYDFAYGISIDGSFYGKRK